MKIILFGYPRSGKTALFNLLTGAGIEIKAYEEGGIHEPYIRSTPLPDPRLDALSALYPEKKKVPAVVDFTDPAGVSAGDVKTGTLPGHLRKADGLIHVVRGFRDARIQHPKGKISPADDIRSMKEDLILADFVLVQARLERLEKDLKKIKDPDGEKEREILGKLRPWLEEGRGLHELSLGSTEEKLLRSFSFLSLKPLLHMINVDERDLPALEAPDRFFGLEPKAGAVLGFCGKIENEILALEDEEKDLFMSGYGLKESSAARFFRNISGFLNMLSFFTIGKDEVRAWTVKRETTALKAAGAIHSDIEKGFIRAEVIACRDLLRHGSLQKAKDAGAIRLEGKDSFIRDGEVVYFRFSP